MSHCGKAIQEKESKENISKLVKNYFEKRYEPGRPSFRGLKDEEAIQKQQEIIDAAHDPDIICIAPKPSDTPLVIDSTEPGKLRHYTSNGLQGVSFQNKT